MKCDNKKENWRHESGAFGRDEKWDG